MFRYCFGFRKKVVPKDSAANGLTLNELNTLTAVELNTVTPVNVHGLNQVEVRGLTRVRFNGVAPLRRNGVAPIEINDLTPAVLNGVAPIETNNLTPTVLNNLTNGSIFFKLPREIRDKIYGLVLLNPIAPKWKGIGHERDVQYMNYLNLLYVSKQIHNEAKLILEELKPFTFVSVNFKDLRFDLLEYGLNYVSQPRDRAILRVNFTLYTLYVEVEVPARAEIRERARHHNEQYLILTSDLPRLCAAFRAKSLTLPHASTVEDIPRSGTFPRMSASVILALLQFMPLRPSKKLSYFEDLVWLNPIGEITLEDCDGEDVRAILPGHAEVSLTQPYTDTQLSEAVDQFSALRQHDRNDILTLLNLQVRLALHAYAKRDFNLSHFRYERTTLWLKSCRNSNPLVWSLAPDTSTPTLSQIEEYTFYAQIGQIKSLLRLHEFVAAAGYTKQLVRELSSRPLLPDRHVAYAKSFEAGIKRLLRSDVLWERAMSPDDLEVERERSHRAYVERRMREEEERARFVRWNEPGAGERLILWHQEQQRIQLEEQARQEALRGN